MERDKLGRWQPGTTGNPRGRPADTTAAAELRRAIRSAAPAAALALLKAAKAGDVSACRAVLNVALPPLRPVEEAAPVDLGSGGIADRARVVLDRVADGSIGTGQAKDLLDSLQALARIAESQELEARVAALEGRESSSAGKLAFGR